MKRLWEKMRSEKKIENFAEARFTNALYEGNMLIPLANEGIFFCLMEKLLQEENIDWKKFSESKIAPDQLERLVTGASRSHKTNEIDINVNPKRFEILWESIKSGITIPLMQYILDQDQFPKDQKIRIAKLETFFNDDKNTEKSV